MKQGFALMGYAGGLLMLLITSVINWQSGALGMQAIKRYDDKHREWGECAAVVWYANQTLKRYETSIKEALTKYDSIEISFSHELAVRIVASAVKNDIFFHKKLIFSTASSDNASTQPPD